jgi:hypothetical protein
VSFQALAIAAAAATEVSRYTGVKPAFLDGLDVSVSHVSGTDGRPVFTVRATAVLFGYLHTTADGHPVGLHDHGALL